MLGAHADGALRAGAWSNYKRQYLFRPNRATTARFCRDEAIRRRRNLSAGGVEFVPFSIEAGGVWGPAARRFFKECIALANDDRDIDLYHWSSPKFSAAWQNTLSVLVARGRAQVSVAAAMADWPKRIRDMRYADHEDRGMAD